MQCHQQKLLRLKRLYYTGFLQCQNQLFEKGPSLSWEEQLQNLFGSKRSKPTTLSWNKKKGKKGDSATDILFPNGGILVHFWFGCMLKMWEKLLHLDSSDVFSVCISLLFEERQFFPSIKIKIPCCSAQSNFLTPEQIQKCILEIFCNQILSASMALWAGCQNYTHKAFIIFQIVSSLSKVVI